MYKKYKVLAALLAALLVLAAGAAAEETGSGQTYYTELKDLVKNVSITGAEVDGDTWTVRPDTLYEMTVFFQETGSKQFDMESETFTYQLPAGIVLGDDTQSRQGHIAFVYGGTTYQFPYSYTIAPDGEVTITPDYEQFKAQYGERVLNAVKQSTNLKIRMDFSGKFNEENVQLNWGNSVKTDVVVDLTEKHDLQINKSAEYHLEEGYVEYTLTVTSEGNNKNIVVKDTITGNALTFDETYGVNISDTGDSTCTLDTETEATFECAIDSMTDGQVIEFTYRANIDFSADSDNDGQLTYDQTHNTAFVTGDDTDEKHTNLGNYIQFSSLSKGNGLVIEGDNQTQKVSWTIDVNKEMIISIGGTTLTDQIMSSVPPMHYSGDYITVEVYDANGYKETRNVSWEQLGVDKETARSYTYTFPQDDGAYYYKITYTTDVDVRKFADLEGTVNNTAYGEHGQDTGSAGITGPADESKPKVSKNVIDYSIEKVTWQVVIHVPAEGLTEEYSKLTDVLPTQNIYTLGNHYVYDRVASIKVEGYPDDNSYTVIDDGESFSIQFYNGPDSTAPKGLKGINVPYDVYVTIVTQNNEEWVTFASTHQDAIDHQNEVKLGIYSDTATVNIGPFVNKSDENIKITEVIVNEKKIRFIPYDIIIGGITPGDPSITIRDEFDLSVFRVPTDAEAIALRDKFSEDQLTIYGGNQWWPNNRAGIAIYNNTSYGMEIIIPDIPDDERTHLNYGTLRIHYWLALRDDVNLDQLAANSEGQKWTTTNTAKWNEVSDDATFEHEYIVLDKKRINEVPISNTNRTAKYQITFNPAQGRVNNGEDIILRDTWTESLNIDYTSIEITTVPESANENVSYSISGYTATYTIPDQTAVIITYNATVLGTGPVVFGNVAVAEGWTAETKDNFTFSAESEGTGSAVSFPVIKVDENNNRIRIPDVTFKLTAPNGFPLLKDPDIYEVTLTTDENGKICIDSADYQLFFFYQRRGFDINDTSTYITYTLTELEPPAGYAPLGFSYTINFTNYIDQVTFDKAYIYPASGGSLQIKNTPLEGLTVRKKTVSSDSDDKNKVFHFKITLNDTSISGKYGKMDDQGRYDGHEVEFVNGVAEFSLKDGEYKQAVGLPSGIQYTIEETGSDGFATVSTGRTADGGTLPSGGTTFTGTTQIEGTEVTFTNTRPSPSDCSITFQAAKILTGREMTGGEFTFGVYEDGETDPIQTVTNDENGVVNFLPIPYTLEDVGIHTYTVKEVVPEGVTPEDPTKDGYTYDLTSYIITVQVSYDSDGILRAGIIDISQN